MDAKRPKAERLLGPAVAVLCAVHTSVLALLMVAVEPADARHEASAD